MEYMERGKELVGGKRGIRRASRGVDMIKVYEIHALLGHEPHYLVQ